MKTRTRYVEASRKCLARCDCSLERLIRTIANTFGIPKESIQLQRTDGRKMRCDATVGALRNQWEWED